VHAAPRAVTSFQNDNAQAGVSQLPRSRQSCEPGADDQDLTFGGG
jgi:hypothetical protein